MACNFVDFVKRNAYSQDTHLLLNNWTLELKDKEIKKAFEKQRADRFDSFFWPFIGLVISLAFIFITLYFL